MKKKLTLTIEEDVVLKAKAYAKGTDRSLSELVESHLRKITNPSNQLSEPIEAYGKEKTNEYEFIIPEWLKGIAGSVNADIDYMRDRDKIREERYSKYLK